MLSGVEIWLRFFAITELFYNLTTKLRISTRVGFGRTNAAAVNTTPPKRKTRERYWQFKNHPFMKRILIAGLLVFIVSNLVGQDDTNLIGRWKLEKYDAFDKVKNTPAYLLGTDEETQRYDDLVRLLLDSTIYEFRPDGTMVYTDMENQKLVKREALWTVKDSILYINELKRPYKREAKIVSLTSSLLIIKPIINGEVGDSKMTFKIIN